MNQSGIAAAQSNYHTAAAYLLNFWEVSVNTLQLKDQTTIMKVEKSILLECTHFLNVFFQISVILLDKNLLLSS
jgi:hypothetical protein